MTQSLLSKIILQLGEQDKGSVCIAVLILGVSYFYPEAVAGMFFVPAMCAGGCSCSNPSPAPASPSTPFLFTWNGKDYDIENDFLFCKPQSCFADKETGEYAYRNGLVQKSDIYKISNNLALEHGKLKFQIKELEPEQSYIDRLKFIQAAYPKDSTLFVQSDFSGLIVIKDEQIKNIEGVLSQKILDQNDSDVSKRIGNDPASVLESETKEDPMELDTGEAVYMKAKLDPKSIKTGSAYLLMGSQYRDWLLEDVFERYGKPVKYSILSQMREIFIQSNVDRSISGILNSMARVVVLVLILSAVWLATAFQGAVRHVTTSPASKTSKVDADAARLNSSYGARVVEAAHPNKSLVVEYWDGYNYQHIDIISPRYYQNCVDAVEIPNEAILEDNTVALRIIATRNHRVNSLLLIKPTEVGEPEMRDLKITKLYHNRLGTDLVDVVSDKSEAYLETIPADVVDIEVSVKDSDVSENNTVDYLLQSDGFYTSMSQETREKVGNYWDQLGPKEQKWLNEMLALSDGAKV